MIPVLAFLLLQSAPAEAPAAPPVEPWPGTLDEGLGEMRRLADEGKPDEALALAERLLEPDAFSRWREHATALPGWKRSVVEAATPLLDAVGLVPLSDPERATVQLARGVVLAEGKEPDRRAAIDAFERALALAGPGDLRLDATYDAGWSWLAEGEAKRAEIPEISGASAPQPAVPTPGPAPGAEPPPPDPLDLARAAYLRARERLVDRLKLEASDADTRANLELVQRRLRELESIEKQREQKEQEEKQKQQQKDSDKDQSKDQQDPKDQESKPDEQEKPDQPKPDEQKPDEPEQQPDQQPEQQPEDSKEKEAPKEAQEEHLTREEVMRLLDILKDREEEGRKLLEQLRQARRAAVKKDW